MVARLAPERAAAVTGGPVTRDLDPTDVEVYGRKKRGVAYNHQGQRVGRPHVAAWAETEIVNPDSPVRHYPSPLPVVCPQAPRPPAQRSPSCSYVGMAVP